MKIQLGKLSIVILLLFASPVYADIEVSMTLIDADGNESAAGTIVISATKYGLVFQPQLRGLTPGLHGFHLHQNPSCAAAEKGGEQIAGLAAGGHFDPVGSAKHGPPWGDGHLGDLPALYVDARGHADSPVLAPRLTLQDLPRRALMVHAGGDNYSDSPKKLGGGGARIACGVID